MGQKWASGNDVGVSPLTPGPLCRRKKNLESSNVENALDTPLVLEARWRIDESVKEFFWDHVCGHANDL